ncbi:MAG: hypothetical protein CMP07_08965 [Xanthomonadales bacterium]|nr:hypothetical protein [Xanthomonadales bacterium]
MKNDNINNVDVKKRGARMTSALFALLFALGGGAALTGCEEQGPAEEAGEEIDEAVEDAGDAVEDAADEIEEETDG